MRYTHKLFHSFKGILIRGNPNLFEMSRICYSLVVRLGTEKRRPAIDSPLATIPIAGAITIQKITTIDGKKWQLCTVQAVRREDGLVL